MLVARQSVLVAKSSLLIDRSSVLVIVKGWQDLMLWDFLDAGLSRTFERRWLNLKKFCAARGWQKSGNFVLKS